MKNIHKPKRIRQALDQLIRTIEPFNKHNNRRISRNILIEEMKYLLGIEHLSLKSSIDTIIRGTKREELEPKAALEFCAALSNQLSRLDAENRTTEFFLEFFDSNVGEFDTAVGDVIVRNVLTIHNQPASFDECKFEYQMNPRAEDMLLPDIEAAREPAIQKIRKSAQEKGSPFFNGPTVRLNRIEIRNRLAHTEENDLVVHMSQCQWFDWSAQQFCLENIDGNAEEIRQKGFDSKLGDTVRDIEGCRVSNQLGTSIVLLSSDWHMLLQRRSGGQDNYGVWGPSASENLSRYFDEPISGSSDGLKSSRFLHSLTSMNYQEADNAKQSVELAGENYQPKIAPNGFLCALRGIWEEVGDILESTSLDSVLLVGAGFDRGYCVPHLFFLVESSFSHEEITSIRNADLARDAWETDRIKWIDCKDRISVIGAFFELQWARISKAAVLACVKHVLKTRMGLSDAELVSFLKL